MPGAFDFIAPALAQTGSSVFKGWLEGRAIQRQEEEQRLRREHQNFLERLESERLRLEQQRESRLTRQGEDVSAYYRRPQNIQLGDGRVLFVDPATRQTRIYQAPPSPEAKAKSERDLAEREQTLFARQRSREYGRLLADRLERSGHAEQANLLRMALEGPNFGEQSLAPFATMLKPHELKAPTSPFGLFMRGQDASRPAEERTASQQQYADYQKSQARAAGERVIAQGQVLDQLPPSHTQSPYRGRIFINPKTYGRIPAPKTVGEATAAWNAGRAIPVTQQQEQQINRLRVAFPLFDALERVLPHIVGASQGAATWAQMIKNLANRAAGSTPMLALFDTLSNDAMVELSTALAGTSRPAVMMMEALRSHSLPRLREALQAGEAKVAAGRSVVKSRVEAILGQAELTPLQLPGLNVNPSDFKLE